MKKLIFVTEALWIGGIETALINLLNQINYAEYSVSVLICRAELELLSRIHPKCRVIVVDRDSTVSAKAKYRYAALYHLTETTESPSRLHRAMMWLTPIIKYIENELFIKYVHSVMSDESFDTAIIYSDRVAEIAARAVQAEKYLLFYHNAKLERKYHDEIGYQKSARIIAVSESKAEELKKFRPRHAEKICAIHNLVDIKPIIEKSKEAQEIVFDDSAFNLVTCGRLAHQKAIDWAIDACKQLLDRGYDNLHWWIVGGGPDEKYLKKLSIAAGVEEHFHFLGMQNNPYPYIANADIYVQPSRYENYSVVILEAMVLCKPIIATIPAADQQIVCGKNGFLCDDNPNAIANAIEYMYNHPDECESYVTYLMEHSLAEENQAILHALYEIF